MDKLLVLGFVMLCVFAAIAYVVDLQPEPTVETETIIYSGPLTPGDDVKYFRETGITRRLIR